MKKMVLNQLVKDRPDHNQTPEVLHESVPGFFVDMLNSRQGLRFLCQVI